MRITKHAFSPTVDRYQLENDVLFVSVLTYGGILQSIRFYGKEMLCSFPKLDGYLHSSCYYGALIGRCCNRMYRSQVGERHFPLTCNENGSVQLHGGAEGFDKKLWNATVETNSLCLTYTAQDGEEGYPGCLRVEVRYTLEGNALRITCNALSDKDTEVNMTVHPYFNLDGPGGDVLSHTLTIPASHISVCDEKHVPTGEHLPVKDTPFDFTMPKQIGLQIREDHPQLTPWGGYDNNYLLDKGSAFGLCAKAAGTDVCLEVLTDQPCVQLYTANDVHEEPMSGMQRQCKHRAFCLEPQREPNIHPALLCRANAPYKTETVYRFTTV